MHVEHFTGHEESGACWWCGKPFPDKRHRHYCSEECRTQYWQHFNWQSAVERCGRLNEWKCQLCGQPGEEVHHIIAVNGEDRFFHKLNVPCNLLLLCKPCHLKLHARYRILDHFDRKTEEQTNIESQIKAGQLTMLEVLN